MAESYSWVLPFSSLYGFANDYWFAWWNRKEQDISVVIYRIREYHVCIRVP